MQNTRREIGALEGAALAVLLVLRVYVVQELLAALVLFSLVCTAVAFLGVVLLLLDALGHKMLLKLQSGTLALATFAQRSLPFRAEVRRRGL